MTDIKKKKKGGLPDAIPPIPISKEITETPGLSDIKLPADCTPTHSGDLEFHKIDHVFSVEKAFRDAGFDLTTVRLEGAVFKIDKFPQLPANCKKVAEKLKEVDFHGLRFHAFGGPGEIHFKEVK